MGRVSYKCYLRFGFEQRMYSTSNSWFIIEDIMPYGKFIIVIEDYWCIMKLYIQLQCKTFSWCLEHFHLIFRSRRLGKEERFHDFKRDFFICRYFDLNLTKDAIKLKHFPFNIKQIPFTFKQFPFNVKHVFLIFMSMHLFDNTLHFLKSICNRLEAVSLRFAFKPYSFNHNTHCSKFIV